MGKKRKGKKVTVQKRVYKIPKLFPCPFCLKQDGIKIEIKRDKFSGGGTAVLRCRKCNVNDSNIPVSRLTEPIDIYNHWMDKAREENKKYNVQRRELDEE